jgi:hypothetical protein
MYNRRLLRISQYLASETSLAPWDTMRAAFRQWELGAQGKLRFQFNAYMLQLTVPVYDVLGWEVLEDDWDKKCVNYDRKVFKVMTIL